MWKSCHALATLACSRPSAGTGQARTARRCCRHTRTGSSAYRPPGWSSETTRGDSLQKRGKGSAAGILVTLHEGEEASLSLNPLPHATLPPAEQLRLMVDRLTWRDKVDCDRRDLIPRSAGSIRRPNVQREAEWQGMKPGRQRKRLVNSITDSLPGRRSIAPEPGRPTGWEVCCGSRSGRTRRSGGT